MIHFSFHWSKNAGVVPNFQYFPYFTCSMTIVLQTTLHKAEIWSYVFSSLFVWRYKYLLLFDERSTYSWILLSVLIDIVNKIFTNMNLEAFVECYRYLSWTYVSERYLCRSHVFWQQLKIHSTHLVLRTVAFCTIVLLRTLTRICFIYLSSVSCLAI